MKIRKALAIVFAFALIAVACGDDDGGSTGGFSSQIRDSYLEECQGDQNAAFCECTFDEIERRFSEAEFIRFAIETTEEPPEEFIEIVFACLSDIDPGG